MGSLRNIPTAMLAEKFGCSILVETGSGLGGSIEFAKQLPFSKIISCEINDYLYSSLAPIYESSNRIKVYHSSSQEMLSDLLPKSDSSAIFFWLDAHFPGADFGIKNYDSEKDENIRLPLEIELRLIKKHRAINTDVIIIDDLRIYEDGPFSNGQAPLPDRLPRGERTLNFIDELFSDTHDITRIYSDEGYIVITPKSKEIKKPNLERIKQDIESLLKGSEQETIEAMRRTQYYFSILEDEPNFFKDILYVFKVHKNNPTLLKQTEAWLPILSTLSNNSDILVFGTGFHAALITHIASSLSINIAAYISSNEKITGRLIDGKPVLSVNGALDSNVHHVIIASLGSKRRIEDSMTISLLSSGKSKKIL